MQAVPFNKWTKARWREVMWGALLVFLGHAFLFGRPITVVLVPSAVVAVYAWVKVGEVPD